jgi:hypothetical protein
MAPTDLVAWRGPVVQEGPKTYRILKFILGSYRLDSILLAKYCIPDPCCEIYELPHLLWQEPMTGYITDYSMSN